jgi:ABC-type Fe3+/spermidine/putrescine transport system ATPase subunit
MQSELKALQREIGIAFLFVTHDQDEAMALSDRIALLRGGALEQVASPRDIYSRPATAYTAEFIGQTNLLRGEINNGVVRCGRLQWKTSEASGPALFSLRPEAIHLAGIDDDAAGVVKFRGTIRQQIYGGASEILEIDCGENQILRARIPASGPLTGAREFIFSTRDAVRVTESSDAHGLGRKNHEPQ